MQSRLDNLKATYRDEYEMQKEAMIQSFSQDFAAQQRQGEDG